MHQVELNVSKNQIPYVQNWIGAWAMHEPYFHAIREQIDKTNVSLHLSTMESVDVAARHGADIKSRDQKNVAIVEINGPLMKHASSFSSSCSTVVLRQQIRDLANDDNVAGIMLVIDSPGGTVAGTKELADEITKAKTKKPIWGYCNDLTASAAYWIASQCDQLEANATSLVGSIGTYCVVTDSKQAADKAGFVVHVVRAGKFKGAGTPGTEVTEEHLEEASNQVNQLNRFFLSAVEAGRQMGSDQVSELADGRVFIASDAKAKGLIDGVSSIEDYLNRFFVSLSPVSPVSHQGEKSMSAAETTVQVQTATIAQLKAEFPKATSEWKLSCLEAGMTIEQARASYCQVLQAQVEAAEKKVSDLEKKMSRPGAKPLPSSRRAKSEDMPVDDDDEEEDEMSEDEYDDEAEAKWNAVVAKYQKTTKTKAEAIRMANKSHPKLRVSMLKSVNRNRPRAVIV